MLKLKSRFDKELEALHVELIEMGSLIESAIVSCVEGLTEKNMGKAKQTMLFEQEVDEKEKAIERRCLKLLLQQQPVATDLRMISTALKMITDMERIGDQASDIAEITIRLIDVPYIKKLIDIPKMATGTIHMVKGSIDAFIRRDLDMAYDVIAYDDVVDDLFNTVKNDLIHMIHEDVNNGEQAIDLLMVAKYFERIGDHAVNIAEWVVFSITGEHKNERIM